MGLAGLLAPPDPDPSLSESGGPDSTQAVGKSGPVEAALSGKVTGYGLGATSGSPWSARVTGAPR